MEDVIKRKSSLSNEIIIESFIIYVSKSKYVEHCQEYIDFMVLATPPPHMTTHIRHALSVSSRKRKTFASLQLCNKHPLPRHPG